MRVVKTKNGRMMVLSNCAFCGGRKSRLTKKLKAKLLLSLAGKIPLLGPLLT